MRRMLLVLASALLLGAAVLAAGCGGSSAASAGAPAFNGTRFDGSQVSLESFRGKPLVLIFWASW